MFAMHNPVTWIDPSGLVVINSPRMREMLGLDHPMNPPPAAPTLPAITITRDGNNVSINAFVRFHGAGASYARRRMVIEGIISHWSGDRGSFYVSVNIVDISTGTHIRNPERASLGIEIRNSAGRSHLYGIGADESLWSITNPGTIVLYTHICPLSSYRAGDRKTAAEFAWVGAHEFGHALGIRDGWGFGAANPDLGIGATDFGNFYSMMVGWMHSVTELDIIFAIRAHNFDTWQSWSDNIWIVETFGTPR